MEIGILTYHRAHNYGAVLQAYALCTFLNSLGHNAEIIDYWPDYRSGEYDLIKYKFYFNKKLSILHRCKMFVFRSLTIVERFIRHKKFENFINQKIHLGLERITTGGEIPNDRYQVIVCGSDQIWAYHKLLTKNGFDEVYYAQYPAEGTTLKLSYAASMGVEDISETAQAEFSKLILNFDSVSVREKSLLSLASSAIKAVQVLDPVFILPVDSWKKMVKPSSTNKRYLLFYQLLKSESAESLAKKIATDKGLEIIEIRGSVTPFLWIQGIECTTGPIDFISLIANSEYVISTSFHGVAFAILFNRQFTAMGFGNNSSRVSSLLQTLGIPQCLRDDGDKGYFDKIDYNALNLRLNEVIEHSTAFLKTHLGNHDKR